MTFPITTQGPMTPADWTAQNPTLPQFCLGIEIDPATGLYGRCKMGDGRTAWNDLRYLDGTETTVANSTARLALTGLTRGARVYQTDTGFWYELTNAAAPSDAASWAIQRPVQTAVLEADFPKTNDTFANVTDLTLTGLLAGHWYRVTGQINTFDANGSGAKLDFAGGTATATGIRGAVTGYDGNQVAVIYGPISALSSVTTTAGGDACVFNIDFTIQVNAGGTLIPRAAQAVTDAIETTFYKYATIQAIDVTPE